MEIKVAGLGSGSSSGSTSEGLPGVEGVSAVRRKRKECVEWKFEKHLEKKRKSVKASAGHQESTFTQHQPQLQVPKLVQETQQKLMSVSERGRNMTVSSVLPTTHKQLLKCATNLTLDLNTMHKYLRVGEDGRTLRAVQDSEESPPHPERFTRRLQVLCREALSGSPCYWEVDCRASGSWVNIAVCYRGMTRSGKRAPLFGRCRNSWALRDNVACYEFWHDDKVKTIDCTSCCGRIGVYLDHGAGLLAFYNTSNMSLIHQVRTSFTQPLYAGFGLAGTGAKVTLCKLDPKEETPSDRKCLLDRK